MLKLFFSLIALSLASCFQNHVFFLTNHMSKDVNVQIFTTSRELENRDSVVIVIGKTNTNILINKNKDLNCYSFLLAKGSAVILQEGSGEPDLSGMIVINGKDTIMLYDNKRIFFEKDDGITTKIELILNDQ